MRHRAQQRCGRGLRLSIRRDVRQPAHWQVVETGFLGVQSRLVDLARQGAEARLALLHETPPHTSGKARQASTARALQVRRQGTTCVRLVLECRRVRMRVQLSQPYESSKGGGGGGAGQDWGWLKGGESARAFSSRNRLRIIRIRACACSRVTARAAALAAGIAPPGGFAECPRRAAPPASPAQSLANAGVESRQAVASARAARAVWTLDDGIVELRPGGLVAAI